MRRILTTIVLIAVGLFASLSFSAVAQNRTPSVQNPPAQTRPAQTNPNQARPSQSEPAQSGPAQNFPANAIDQQFATEAGYAGMAGIMMGELALQRSTNPQVKQFAQAEIQEQRQLKSSLSRLVQRLGVTLPTTPSPRHQAAMAQLSKLSGTQFDQAYMDEGGVNAHLENAVIYQREAAFGQNPDMVALARRALPTINQHYTTATNVTNYRFAQVPRQYNGLPTSSGASRNAPGGTGAGAGVQ